MDKAFVTKILDINLVNGEYQIQVEVQKIGEVPETANLHVTAPWGSDWRYSARQAVIAHFSGVDGVVFPDLTTM